MTLPPAPLPSSLPQSIICDKGDDPAVVSTDEDEDTLRRVIHNFGVRSGDFVDARYGSDSESCSDGESNASDDITYLRRLQEQFLPPSSVSAVPSIPMTPSIPKLNRALPPSDTDDEDDFETLRAIQRRFACYRNGATLKDFSPETSSTISVESEEAPLALSSTLVITDEHQEQSFIGLCKPRDEANKFSVFSDAVPSDTSVRSIQMSEDYQEYNHISFNEDEFCSLTTQQFIKSRFPKSVQNFVSALKKNRSYQRFIRSKLVEIEAKMEVNKKLKERIKCLMDFQNVYRRKLSNSLCQKRDPRVMLISLPKRRLSRSNKENSIISPALYCSPEENSQRSNYMMVMRIFPVSHRERQWSNKEKDTLCKGIKQQYQEMLVLNCLNLGSNLDGSIDSLVMSTIDSANHQMTPEMLRSFIPLINWERLASMYLPKRSGPSCETRWLNHEDPMINHNAWTLLEDKKLLFTVQERGLYNWIDMAVTLGTNRTPFQCLARYQRSLNPHILNREWSSEEDAKLYAAVTTFGDKNWQVVASHLDGRTSNQCSVRWRNSLLPERRRVGRWSVEEDKHLKASVILFGAKNWNKIAQFVPGRTQSQCRERWLNCLDPSLNLERWTDEEDLKLLAAIAEHGYSWSKIAAHVPGRTDNHCRRRWKALLPDEVPKLKAAQKLKKTVLISNFVGRESERSALGPNDFTPIMCLPAPNIENSVKVRKRRSSYSKKLKKARKKSKSSTEEMSTESRISTSTTYSFGKLALVSGENADSINAGCFNRKQKRLLGNKQSMQSQAKTIRDEEQNLNGNSMVINAEAGHFDLPLVTISENACIKRTKKRSARNKESNQAQTKTLRVDENLNGNGLVITADAAHFDLPLLTISENVCFKRTKKRTSRTKHPRKFQGKTAGYGDVNSTVCSLAIATEAAQFDLPLEILPPSISERTST